MSIHIPEGREVKITPVRGGFIVEWDDIKLVEKSKVIPVQAMLSVAEKTPMMDPPKSMSKEEFLIMTSGHQIAVRETVEGTMCLVAGILKGKLEVMKGIDLGNVETTSPASNPAASMGTTASPG